MKKSKILLLGIGILIILFLYFFMMSLLANALGGGLYQEVERI